LPETAVCPKQFEFEEVFAMGLILPRFASIRVAPILCGALLLLGAGFGAADDNASKRKVIVDAKSFRCIRDMTPVRYFYVDNLLGDLDATLAAAKSPTGGEYPPGTVIAQLPNKPMVKHEKGFNPKTYDWEFFNLEISKDGTVIQERGFAEINSAFGGSCFGCHDNVAKKWDLVCDVDHGCVAVPFNRAMVGALQRTDPRCKNGPVSAEDAELIRQFKALPKG
jgi:hypothetical protein